MTAFNRMYKSFSLFGTVRQGESQPFLEMSSGVNWMMASPAIVKCLHLELDSALTYRNYGRSAGPSAVTEALERVESLQNAGIFKPAVTVTNGTTEGSHLVFELLSMSGRIKPGDCSLMIGHGYPLYSHLSEKFGLQFHEVLGNPQRREEGYIPEIREVVERIRKVQPTIVFHLVPNNPLGERYGEADLFKLVIACDEVGAVLLVDRVCLLPWDDYNALGRATARMVEAGDCFIADSFSKTESLAGIRTGFLVSNVRNRDLLIELTRARWLNPVVFSCLSLAFSRIALVTLDGRGFLDKPAATQWAHEVVAQLAGDCISHSAHFDAREAFVDFRARYEDDVNSRRRIVRSNYNALIDRYGKSALHQVKLTAGFNAALALEPMIWRNEENDQLRLAEEFRVGVLPERTFRTSLRSRGNYFLRIGLTLPTDVFAVGLDRIGQYFNL